MSKLMTLENESVRITYNVTEKEMIARECDAMPHPCMLVTNHSGHSLGELVACWDELTRYFHRLTDMQYSDVIRVLREQGVKFTEQE